MAFLIFSRNRPESCIEPKRNVKDTKWSLDTVHKPFREMIASKRCGRRSYPRPQWCRRRRSRRRPLVRIHHRPRCSPDACSNPWNTICQVGYVHLPQLEEATYNLEVCPWGVCDVDRRHGSLRTSFKKGESTSRYFETTYKQKRWRSIPRPHMASW